MQTASDFAQVFQHIVEAGSQMVQLLRERGGPSLHGCLRGPQVQGEGDQALLRAVVQIALDAAAGGVGGGDDPCPGCSQGGLRLGVGDRGGGQFSEAGQSRLGVGRQRLHAGRSHHHDAPEASLDDDWYTDGRADPVLADGFGNVTRGPGVVVDPGRPARLEHHGVQIVPAEPPPGADRELRTGPVPRGDHRSRTVGAVPAHGRVISVQQPPGLLGDRGQYLGRRRRFGHERRYPPERGLFLRELAQFDPGLGVGDRGRDQFGKPGQPGLGVLRQRLVPGSHDHDAPQAPFHAHRYADGRADPELADGVCDRAPGSRRGHRSALPGRSRTPWCAGSARPALPGPWGKERRCWSTRRLQF